MPSSQFPSSSASTPGLRVSICIPAYNEGERLLPLIHRLQSMSLPEGRILEILVDVSGSTDDSRELLSKRVDPAPPVRVLDSGVRDGLVPALNRLIAAAQGNILVRIDADVLLEDGAIPLCLAAVQERGVGIAGPRVVPLSTRENWAARIVRTLYSIHDLISREAPKTTVVQVFLKLPLSLPVDSVMEDAALQHEIAASGYSARYVFEAVVHIYGPSTLHDLVAQRVRTIRAIQWFTRHYHTVPSTASPGVVLRAMKRALREGQIGWADLGAFAGIEALCRGLALFYRMSTKPPVGWTPVESTKPRTLSSPGSSQGETRP